MGADVPLLVQSQAFPELTGLYRMQQKATQDKKDYEEMLAMAEMREREYDIERVRNDLVILNRFYLRGGIVTAHPARVFYYQHDPQRYHPIGTATRQYSPRSPIEPIASGSNIKINPEWYDLEEEEDDLDMMRYDQHHIPTPEPSPPPDVKGKGVAGQPSKRTKFNKYGF